MMRNNDSIAAMISMKKKKLADAVKKSVNAT